MIIVTGTKRSGTSMWMQILRAAGLPSLGEAFPHKWKDTIGDANPEGFYESEYRNGIYFRTNPDPKTGDYLRSEDTELHAVKVFVPGLARTERAYIRNVIATLRPWREYATSVKRLREMELARSKNSAQIAERAPRIPPVLEWWDENLRLLRDQSVRRYPMLFRPYADVLAHPDKVVRQAIAFLGVGDADAAVAAVKVELRTQRDIDEVPGVGPGAIKMLDRLQEGILSGDWIDPKFVRKMATQGKQLSEAAAEHHRKDDERRRRSIAAARKARAEQAAAGNAAGPGAKAE